MPIGRQEPNSGARTGAMGGANRRPPSAAGARTNTGAAPGRVSTASSSRPGGGLSRVASSSNIRQNAAASTPSSAATENGRSRKEGEDIRVFVRVRGKAPNEAPIQNPILSTSGPRSQQLIVSHLSEQGGVLTSDPALEKTYTFDGVFGPDAEQSLVYQDVVVPMLNDVLAGYKCTIFAYGQTGTGKTHTMEGNLSSSDGFHLEAGIIPRTLDRLFHQVEMSEQELSVRATFLELYNEDLRDLLSPDLAAPGQGKGNTGAGFRIYEKDGEAHVQGLRETTVTSAEEGLALLRKGSKKRQVAATNCNDASSRSHSIFTLTIYAREKSSTAKEDDMYRVGKLRLVDLAGSESIERSGAKEKGAREAGMINKSLLALGRVINALVEGGGQKGGGHIPYRESNLTRLLADSLGGGTKTCIIATVSQARSNLDETLSTLDYALRAKSIKNRPELNSKVSRGAIITDLEEMVKRQQSDLDAYSLNNGRCISEENWARMQSEHEAVSKERDELRHKEVNNRSNLAAMQERVENMAQRDAKRQAENAELRSKYSQIKHEMEHLRSRNDLVEENEKILYANAMELQQELAGSASESQGLRAKIGRQSQHESLLISRMGSFERAIQTKTAELEAKASEMQQKSGAFAEEASGALTTFVTSIQASQRDHGALLAQQEQALKTVLQQVEQHLSNSTTSSKACFTELEGTINAIVRATKEQSSSTHSMTKTMLEQHADHIKQQRKQNDAAIKSFAAEADGVITLFSEHLQRVKEELDQLKSSTTEAFEQSMKAVIEENQLLSQEVERLATMLESDIDQAISQLNAVRTNRLSQLPRLAAQITKTGQEAETRTQGSLASMGQGVDSIMDGCGEVWSQLEQKQVTIRQGHDNLHAALKSNEKALRSDVQGVMKAVSDALEAHAETTNESAKELLAMAASGQKDILGCFEEDSRSAKVLGEMVSNTIKAGVQYGETSAQGASHFAASQEALYKSHASSLLTASQGSSALLADLRSSSKKHLKEELEPCVSTGETPAKKTYNFARHLSLAPQPQLVSRSGRTSTQSNASVSSQLSANSITAGLPRASDLGRLLQPIKARLSDVVGAVAPSSAGAAPPSRAGSATPTAVTPTASQQQHSSSAPVSSTAAPVTALKDLSKTLNLPRNDSASSGLAEVIKLHQSEDEDMEADAVDTSLGTIKRKRADVDQGPAAADAKITVRGTRSKKQRIGA